MTLDSLLARLENVTQRGSRYTAICPAHSDKHPSLQIREGERRLLVKCWSGCSLSEICASLQLTQQDLFYDGRNPTLRGSRPTTRPVKIDYTALAFQYELAALDRRLRADNVLKAATHLSVEGLDDTHLDRLMEAVANAYTDRDGADLLETVADDLRVKAFQERTAHHAA